MTAVGHFDIGEFVGDVLHGDAVTAGALIDALRRLWRPTYRHLSEVDLDDIPVRLATRAGW